jgi:hypothetical protein
MPQLFEDMLKPDPMFQHLLSQGMARQRSIEEERRKFQSDPALVEKILSHWAHRTLPEKAAGKIAIGSPLEKIEKGIPEGDPRKGLASKLLFDASDIIEKSPGVHPSEALTKEYWNRMSRLNKDDALYKTIREKNSALFGAEIATAPGYEKWKEGQEKPDWEMTNPLLSFGLGAAFSLAGAGLGSLLAPGPGTAVGGLAGRAAGTAVGGWLTRTLAMKAGQTVLGQAGRAGLAAIPSFAVFDVPSNIIRRSDWAQDRPWSTLGAELVLGGGAAHLADKTALKLYKPVTEAFKDLSVMGDVLAKEPSVSNLIKFSDVRNAAEIKNQNLFDFKFGPVSRGEIKTALPKFDEEMRGEFLAGISKGGSPEDVSREVLKNREIKTAFERTQQIQDAARADELKYITTVKSRMDANPEANPMEVARGVREELDMMKGVFSPEWAASEAVDGFKVILLKSDRKFNSVIVARELAQNKKEYDVLAQKHLYDYENPLNYASMSKKELLGRVEELNAAKTRGILDETTHGLYLNPLEKAIRDKGLIPQRDMSLFDITGSKVETPEFATKLSNELEGAINSGDSIRFNSAINHYMLNGSGKNAKEVADKIAPLMKNERYTKMVQLESEKITKETEALVQGDLGATKKAIAKDMKTLNPMAIMAKYGKLGLYGGVGAIATSLALVDANDLHAGVIKPDMLAFRALKAVTPKVTDDVLMKSMAEKGFATPKLTTDMMGVESYQKSLNFTDIHGRAPDVTKDVANKGNFSRFFSSIMTPGAVGQFIFKPFSSAQPILASKTTAALNNTEATRLAVNNILKPFGVNSTEVAEMFKPLVDKYSVPLHELGEYKHQLDIYNQILSGKYSSGFGGEMDKLSTRIKKGKLDPEDLAMIEEFGARRDGLIQKVTGYEDASKTYLEEWNGLARNAAQKYPSSRIYFAANGMGMDSVDPWVKSFLTHDEQVAAMRVKDIMGQYSERAVNSGMDVITSKDFMHYVAHPDTDWTKIKGAIDSIAPDSQLGIDMARFHRRGYDTLPMMPDIHYAMERYIPDANMRIEMASFWKEWRPFMAQAKAAGYTAVNDYMESIAKGFSPTDQFGSLNRIANAAQMFEVARLISLSTSVGFKHAMKVMANVALGGIGNAIENLPKAGPIWKDIQLSNMLHRVPPNLRSDLAKAHIGGQNLYLTISDMLPSARKKNVIEEGLDWWNKNTNFIVNNVELADRSFSFASAVSMAAKQGMTPSQASYLVYDTILKANFLSGVHNPSWLRDPKVRLLLLFQGTPYKIFEQRMITAVKGGGAFVDATKELMRQLRGDLETGKRNFQLGMIKDALLAPKDLNGKSYAGQLMRTLLTAGLVVQTGKYLGDVNISQQVFHVPFTSSRQGEQSVALAMNPMISAGYQTMMSKDDSTNDVIEFFKKWLPSGGVPASIIKASRLSKNDIPEIYGNSKFKYIFGMPNLKED